jgi:hypothetical protein
MRMHSSLPRAGWSAARHTVAAVALLGCYGDPQCINYPCPQFEAATISVTAANAPAGIPGVTVANLSTPSGSTPCQQAAVTVCHLMGGRGTYRVQVSAPNYLTELVTFTVNGTDAGCSSCGSVDKQQVAVTLRSSIVID